MTAFIVWAALFAAIGGPLLYWGITAALGVRRG